MSFDPADTGGGAPSPGKGLGVGPGAGIGAGRWIIALAAVSGLLAVGLGAYGAHGLAAPEEILRQFRTANQYHMWHTISLFGAGLFLARIGRGRGQRPALLAAVGFVLGIVLFCGSLYLATALGIHTFTPLAPWGGMAFMGGWGALAVAALRAA
ncbi:MAG: DUF423 domain-containing protein [Rhodospirillaceae bacterium]